MTTVNDIVDCLELPDVIDFDLFDVMGRAAVDEMSPGVKHALYESYGRLFFGLNPGLCGSPVGYDLWLSNLPQQISAEIRLRVVKALKQNQTNAAQAAPRRGEKPGC